MTIRWECRLEALSSLKSWGFQWIIDVDGAVSSLVKSCHVFASLGSGEKKKWKKKKPKTTHTITCMGQGHGRTVILKLSCWLKGHGNWQRNTHTQRGGWAGRVGGRSKGGEEGGGTGEGGESETDCSYPTRYPEWQPGNKGSIKAVLGGQSENFPPHPPQLVTLLDHE